jgi:hypothetical protein
MENIDYILQCTSPSDKSKWVENLMLVKIQAERHRIFGSSLTFVMASAQEQGRLIPSFFETAIHTLLERGLKVEGIFRLSGSVKDIENLKRDINNGKSVSFVGKDVHSIVGLVRHFLSNLPESLLTNALMPTFKKIGGTPLHPTSHPFSRHARPYPKSQRTEKLGSSTSRP